MKTHRAHAKTGIFKLLFLVVFLVSLCPIAETVSLDVMFPGPPTKISKRICQNGMISAGNFNGDKNMDLLCSFDDGWVRIYLAANNRFNRVYWEGHTPRCAFQSGSHRYLADFDNDGYDDLFCYDPLSGKTNVVLFDGEAYPDEISWTGDIPECKGADKMTYVFDANGDGKADLGCGTKSKNGLEMLYLNEFQF
ncbi:uncharacterized protein LOC100181963 [Ciona intestinalis]